METGSLLKIYRHLVKSLHQESLEEAQITTNGLLGDRAFAFQFLDTPTDASEEAQPWLSKFNLAVQHDWPSLAQLIPSWHPKNSVLKIQKRDQENEFIEGNVNNPADRKKIANFVFEYLQKNQAYEKARHPQASELRLIGNSDFSTRYTDGEKGPISFALTESLKDLENKTQFKIDERRFRLNLFLEGAAAWSELSWGGRKLQIGECEFLIYKPIGRCPNIDVHQDTGERCQEIYPLLKSLTGHSLFGMKAEVLKTGKIKAGDPWKLV